MKYAGEEEEEEEQEVGCDERVGLLSHDQCTIGVRRV